MKRQQQDRPPRRRVAHRVSLPFEPRAGQRVVRVEPLKRPHGGRVLVVLEVDAPGGAGNNAADK